MNKEKKYSAEKITAIAIENLESQIDRLKAKVKALEQQLANIKYLNADEVRAIYDKLFITMGVGEFIRTICKLAIPDIDRDKIIEVLGKYFGEYNFGYLDGVTDEIIKARRG